MKKNQPGRRRLRLESLEDRRMMAVFTVDDSFASDNAAARHYTTIQAAVDAAAAGDKIKVKAGNYAENVVIDKQLTLEGAGAKLSKYLDPKKASIIDPIDNDTDDSPAVALDLEAGGIVIKGFTIGEFDSNTDADGTIGIRTSATDAGYKIEHNVIDSNTIGIDLNSSTSTTSTPAETKVEDNVIRNNNQAKPDMGNGIFSNGGLQNALIKGNKFTGTNSETSIRVVGSTTGDDSETATLQSGITVKDNKFSGVTGGGIYIENVVDSLIDDNDLTNIALTGIELNGGNEGVTISHNDLDKPGTTSLYGILLSDDQEIGANTNNIIKNNHISDAGLTGIAIQDSSSNTLDHNKITRGAGGTSDSSDTDGNGISLKNADSNTLVENATENNSRNGIFIDSDSTGNTLTNNESKKNNTADIDAFDYNDATIDGSGTAGTENTYTKNKGRTQNVTGLIAKKI